MKLYYDGKRALLEYKDEIYYRPGVHWDALISRSGLYDYIENDLFSWETLAEPFTVPSTPPIGQQEIWAAGVTYLRSKTARMEESKDAGGGTFYDRVYDAPRPELFMKATAARSVGWGGIVNIRRDARWNVPEPELTLLISSEGTIEGYSIGNDMSSRDIEGENPLYLPQAKVYDRCAGLGPCILVRKAPLPSTTLISMQILRGGNQIFSGEISIDQIKRDLQELADYLYRETSFPNGCFLMTGTGIVPPDDFTLAVNDEIRISIDGIGTLVNFVGMRP